MTTKIAMFFCASALCASAWIIVRAEEPVPAPNAGRVLVLDNERTLEGAIERVGDQYCVRHSVGELWVPSAEALRLCATREEAYVFLRARANLRDPDERLRLAHWCQLHGLREQALEEVSVAVELRPKHAASRHLLESLQRSAALTHLSLVAPPQDEPDTSPNPPAVSTESLSLFITRVQPILMNACASCHATGRGGAFKLARVFDRGLAGRRTIQQNLAAVLAQVTPERPQASPLLAKAVTVHGDMAQPALQSRKTAAFQALEEWIRVTLANSPQLQANASVPLVPTPIGEPASTVAPEPASRKPGSSNTELDGGKSPSGRPVLAATVLPAQEEIKEVGKPSPAPSAAEPVDPYDPLIFNRQMHPQGKAEDRKP